MKELWKDVELLDNTKIVCFEKMQEHLVSIVLSLLDKICAFDALKLSSYTSIDCMQM